LFGSVLGQEFDPARSDVDFVVEFLPMPPVEHADSYFGLAEDLEALLGRRVDLVEPRAIRNPYVKRSVEETQEVLYEAA
jgi:predicted nucleotidyltransferase